MFFSSPHPSCSFLIISAPFLLSSSCLLMFRVHFLSFLHLFSSPCPFSSCSVFPQFIFLTVSIRSILGKPQLFLYESILYFFSSSRLVLRVPAVNGLTCWSTLESSPPHPSSARGALDMNKQFCESQLLSPQITRFPNLDSFNATAE